MTLTLDLTPEIETELARQAAARGMGIGDYAVNLLAEATLTVSSSKPNAPPEPKDMVELFAPIRGLNLDFERDRDPGREIDL
jgi:hypothetical protein